MQITRRTGLTYAFLALGGTALPRLAAAQTVAATVCAAASRGRAVPRPPDPRPIAIRSMAERF